MNDFPSWLPPIISNPGNWNDYLELLYKCFRQDFVLSKPRFGNKRVNLKRHPEVKDKEATFWHFIQEAEDSKTPKSEEARLPSFRRCERISWPKPVMEEFSEMNHENGRIVWWKTERQSFRGKVKRYVLALPDFSYVVIIDDREDYVLPWTQFPVEYSTQREKLRKEFKAYWK